MMNETSESGVAVVVGAGTMGGGIAADLANAGWTVHLLDVTREAAGRGKERALAARPPLLFLPEFAARIRPGVTADDAQASLAAADWVVEAVAEDLGVKRAVLSLIEANVRPNAVVTSNTSGLGLSAMAAFCRPEFRQRFFGAHFLNPPRYLKLLEVIPTPEADPAVVDGFCRFAEGVLGHRVVRAKDTPGFISTRLWVTHLLDTIHTAVEMGVDVETVDALTGTHLGRPKSATFRMADVVGLDIVAAVARNQYAALPDDPLRERLRLPAVMERLIESGRLGEKSGAGFYRREGRAIHALDLTTGEYRPRREVTPDPSDPAQKYFLDAILGSLFAYARAVRPEIAESGADVDRTMRWGFGWEKGPFAMAAERAGTPPPAEPKEPAYVEAADLPVVESGEVATLRDLGDGVFCLELHTKMNTFGPALCDALVAAVVRAERGGRALVVTGRGPHFSAGYDLTRLVSAMERGDLGAIDTEMRHCQEAFMRVKYAGVPVIAAARGYALGAGCELAMHCRSVVAAPELHMGLPEATVGVIPCGGGVKETLARLPDRTVALRSILCNRNSGSAHEARKDGRLHSSDVIVRNGDRLLYEAKRVALRRAAEGRARPSFDLPPADADERTRLAETVAAWQAAGDLAPYDSRIAAALIDVLCGGPMTEAALLERERAAFRELCREPKTRDRMRHLLETGKPLRN